MPRAVWSGVISFGLVTIPVRLYTATSRKTVRFHQIDERDGSRIKYRKVSADTGEEVPADHIVRAWEAPTGGWVTVADDELDQLRPEKSRTIDIEAFVELHELDPVLYDTPYYAVPDEGFEKAYALLLQALEERGRVAVARFVRGGRQYLAAIRPTNGRLDVSTMVWPDEVVDPATVEGLAPAADVTLTDAELAMATQLVDALVTGFDPSVYHDDYRRAVVDLLERKAAGDEIVAAADTSGEGSAGVVDLLAALEASVAAVRAQRDDAADDGPEAAAAASA